MKEIISQIATDSEQSKRLITLGVLPQTADFRFESWNEFSNGTGNWSKPELYIGFNSESASFQGTCRNVVTTPAWSLTQLMAMMPENINGYTLLYNINIGSLSYASIIRDEILYLHKFEGKTIFDKLISCIEYLIALNRFNKEYLK